MKQAFDKFSIKVGKITGHSYTFAAACAFVILWAISGPYFNYSENWQLTINTATTIITFLMVFVIQCATNIAMMALQVKQDETNRAIPNAREDLKDLEERTEEEIRNIRNEI